MSPCGTSINHTHYMLTDRQEGNGFDSLSQRTKRAKAGVVVHILAYPHIIDHAKEEKAVCTRTWYAYR